MRGHEKHKKMHRGFKWLRYLVWFSLNGEAIIFQVPESFFSEIKNECAIYDVAL